MNRRLHAQVKAPLKRSPAAASTGLLQRKSACGAANARHDFSRVSIFATQNRGGIYVDGPDPDTKDTKKTPPPATTQKPATKPKCPTNIEVTNVEQISDAQFGKNGMLTGIGAVALMTVSDAGGNNFDGTAVKETVTKTKNTCGDWAKKVCSNESGEPVDFKVGEESKVLGKKVTKFANSFYDLHMFTREVSVLHQLGKDTCEVQCSQTYQCGGKQFGPEFVITYSASKDKVANFYDVTRITVDKTAKAASP